MKKIRLFTPGPCTVPEEALLEMARPFEHHRTAWFKEVIKDCTEKLQKIFLTTNEVLIITGSGTAAMEGAIVGCHPAGSKALVCENGKFSERWGLICDQYGIANMRCKVEWGKPIDPAVVADHIAKDKSITSVIVVHSETSTATASDLEAIGKICRQHNKLLLADCITSAGALPLRTDDWGVDVLITGSQKALMLPPGLGFAAVSPRAWEVIEANKAQHSFYVNYNKARKSAKQSDTPYTPAHLLVRGLRVTLDLLLNEGLENVWKRVAGMAAATRAAASAMNVQLFSQRPADSVTAFNVPAPVVEKELRKMLREKFGIHFAGGQDAIEGKIVRMSHMGFIDSIDTLGAIAAFEHSLHKLGHNFTLGAGVAAAQKVFVERGM
ncbi:MAG: alanine--glyoxylate aminotransferase family protein [Phycisphaerales bacterium]|nr:alanine--glyoxylate aminotransferase family protein [Phycisphaerales bacterium]